MFKTTADLVAFVVICTILFLLLITLVTIFVLKFQQRKLSFIRSIDQLNINHSNELLKVEIEVQEQTFQNISREVHDNISQQLTLAKLQLNLLNKVDNVLINEAIQSTLNLISDVIKDLSDLSRSMSSEIIHGNGLIKAIEFEINQLNKLLIYDVKLKVLGDSYYLKAENELVIFRIIQEALNNIIKHAKATRICVELNYNKDNLLVEIKDNGVGLVNLNACNNQLGLKNMARRTEFLNGTFQISSQEAEGTIIKLNIPTNEK